MSCEIKNTYDLCVLQNQTFELPFQLFTDDGITPIDVTGWSFTGSIRPQFNEPTTLFFTTSVDNAATGQVRLYLSAEDTWTLTENRYVYDLISNNTTVTPTETLRLMQGRVSVRPGVTEP